MPNEEYDGFLTVNENSIRLRRKSIEVVRSNKVWLDMSLMIESRRNPDHFSL